MSKYDGRVTVADLLRREGVTQELPVVDAHVDETPTERIPVADLLRREGRWDRRQATRLSVVAAGVAALAGLVVSALGVGHATNASAPVAGGSGGGAFDPLPSTSSVGDDSEMLASAATQANGGPEGSASLSGAQPGSGGSSAQSAAQPAAPDQTTTSTLAPPSSRGQSAPVGSPSTTTPPSSPGTTTTTPSPSTPPSTTTGAGHSHGGAGGDVLSTISGTVGGVVGGILNR